MNKSKGFTIIELVVVIAIIAILASIVLISVSGYINKGKDATMQEELHAFQTNAISTANGGNYPITGTGSCLATSQSVADSAWWAIAGNSSSKGPYYATAFCVQDSTTTPTKFCACAQDLSDTANMWCVDSDGKSEKITGKVCGTDYCTAAAAKLCQ